MLPFIKTLILTGLYAISWSTQPTPDVTSKPDLQKVYNEALAWSKTKLEQMPAAQQQQVTSGIGVCKGKDSDDNESSEISVNAKKELPLTPGCNRKKPIDSDVEGAKSLDLGNAEPAQDKILVFVSFSMPKASLEALSQVAEQHNAVLVMRGLRDDSFKATQKAFQELGDQTQSGIEINPEAFETYQIKKVPVFVLVKAGGQNNPEELARLSGNVSLSFAAKKLREAD